MPIPASSMTFLEIYNWIIDKINTNLPSLTFRPLDASTQNLLSNIQCQYPYLDTASFWEQLTKLCNIVGLHIYENENKEIIVYSDFGG